MTAALSLPATSVPAPNVPAPGPAFPTATVPSADGAPVVAVVAADSVPPGATVLGVVVLLPSARSAVGLHAVPSATGEQEPDGPPPWDDLDDVAPPVHEWLRPGLSLDRDGRSVTRDGEPLELTRREFDLLAHLASRPGRVLTRGHLLTAVWGHDDPRWTGPRTVDVHVARLRRKLGGHGRCVQTVRGVGYRWLP